MLVRAPSARAEPHNGLDLSWQAPAECPTREFVQGQLRELLGEAADRASHLHAQGEIVRIKSRYRLTLRLRESGPGGERVIDADSCSALAGAAAVALGLLIQVELQARDQGPTSSPPSATETTPASAPTGRSESARARDSKAGEPPVRFIIQAPAIGIDAGPLPEPALTFGLALGLRFRRWDALLGARATLLHTVWSNGDPRYGAELQSAAFELRGCYRFREGSFEGGPCLHAALDRIMARGVGDEVSSRTSHAFVPAVGLGAHGRWRWTQFVGVAVSIGAELELSRPRLVVEGLEELAQLAPFGFAGNTAIEWIW